MRPDAPHTLALGFDTSGPYCAAALTRGDTLIATRTEDMARGQAERLMPLLEALLADNAIGWRDLDVLGVGIGPGNFTGIRIAVSAARGLALGLGIPAVGVTGFEARAQAEPAGVLIGIPAPRAQIYIADPDPRLVAQDDMPQACTTTSPNAQAIAIARIAATRAHDAYTPPAPLYVRAADAAPARDAPPVLLDP